MNPTQDPLQPQNIPPTPAPTPAPAPFGAPQGIVPPTQAPAPQPVQPFGAPAAPTQTFGSGVMGGQPAAVAPATYAAAKKPLNKKLIIIIGAAVVVVIAIVLVLLLVVAKSGTTASNGGVIGAIKSAVAPASQLTEYKGTAFSFSYPKTFKSAPLAAAVPSGYEVVNFTSTGQIATDGSVSAVSVGSSPYTAQSPRAQELQTFQSSLLTKIPDTATSKDVTFTQSTYQGFESITGTGTVLKDGTEVAKSTTVYIFGNNNLYLITIDVATADTSTVGAETSAILASLKINE